MKHDLGAENDDNYCLSRSAELTQEARLQRRSERGILSVQLMEKRLRTSQIRLILLIS